MTWLGGEDVVEERDLGASIVSMMRSKLQVDEAWIVDRSHGFRWWPSVFTQEVWAEEVETGVGVIAHNLWIRTEVLRAPAPRGETIDAAIRAFAPLVTLYGFEVRQVSGDVILCLMSSVAVHSQTEKVLSPLAVDAAVVQLSVAMEIRDLMVHLRKGDGVGLSYHPTNGERIDIDDMCYACDAVIRPMGESPSRCSEAMLSRVANGVHALWKVWPSQHIAPSLVYDLNQDGRQLRLTAEASRHPLLGAGALVTLETDRRIAEADAVGAILEAQRLDAEATTLPLHRLGSWCLSPSGALSYACFLPNASLGSADPLLQVVATQFVRARLTV